MELPNFLKKKENKKVERGVEKQIAEWGEGELDKDKERRAEVEAVGAEKATTEQIYNLRREIGEEEEKSAERHAQVKLMGPEKANKEQEETFRPVGETEPRKASKRQTATFRPVPKK